MNWFKHRHWSRRPEPLEKYPALQTERLVLRMFTPCDTVDVFAYAQSKVVGPMAGWQPHRSIEESRQVVEHFIHHGDVWAIVEKKSGRVIGSVGLHADLKREVENARMIGYALGEKYWGKGYATEAAAAVLRFAFEDLNCPVVSAYHFPGNRGSKHVIEKLGFVPEGTLRLASTLPDGAVADNVCYSMTRGEYATLTGRKAGKRKPAAEPTEPAANPR
ncbi:MAG TPA: GNAT family protein [Candidatus Limiplasma sp.]|nr:GNAT family protein [Candidatus Limiplasma sp.]HPS80830.1 GNAT family protein [Candidatus Limiplasma sp.]